MHSRFIKIQSMLFGLFKGIFEAVIALIGVANILVCCWFVYLAYLISPLGVTKLFFASVFNIIIFLALTLVGARFMRKYRYSIAFLVMIMPIIIWRIQMPILDAWWTALGLAV